MDDLTPITPGKLKRKTKRSPSSAASVVDLPAVTEYKAHDSILGDALLSPTAAPPTSTPATSEPISPFDAASPALLLKDDDAQPPSPLDALTPQTLHPNRPVATPLTPSPSPHPIPEDPASAASATLATAPSRERKKITRPLPAESVAIEDILAQNREIQQKTLDTLAKLQNANALTERRYGLFLFIAFALLAVVTVVGIVVGIHFQNSAKFNDLKFKHEAYINAVNTKNILEAEFDKEKKGSAAAFEVYQRIEEGLFEESVEKFTAVRNELTHPAEIALLEQRIDEIRWKLAENAYHDGVMLYNASNYEQARDAFFKSLSHKENTAYTPRLNFHLAMSLYQLGDFEGARHYFSRLSPNDLSADMDATARFTRALCAEKLGFDDEAYEQFDAFLKKYRFHKLSDEASKHRAKLEGAKPK